MLATLRSQLTSTANLRPSLSPTMAQPSVLLSSIVHPDSGKRSSALVSSARPVPRGNTAALAGSRTCGARRTHVLSMVG